MKNNIFRFFLFSVIYFTSSSIFAQNYSDWISKVQTYQDSIKLIRHEEYDILDTTTFKLNTYLGFFDNIKIPQNLKIGVFYFDNFLDGNPYLFVLNKSQDLESIIDSISSRIKRQESDIKYSKNKIIYNFLNNPCTSAKNNILPKNCDFGYLQYLFFHEMGEQFKLKWHANRNEKYIICSMNEINRIIDNYDEYITNNPINEDEEHEEPLFSVKVIKDIKNLKTDINIKKSKNAYIIDWIENRTHMGIYKCRYSIEKKYPNKITLIEEDKLIEITPGFLY